MPTTSPRTPTADANYHSLREQVEDLLTETRLHRTQTDNAHKVVAYWHIGDALTAHLDGRLDSTYGQTTTVNLSKDTYLKTSVLYDILRLRKLLPTFPAPGELSWTYYRTLVHLPDAVQLRHYQRLATDRGWTTRQLNQAMDADLGGALLTSAVAAPRLQARFGQLLTYRVVADPLRLPAVTLGLAQDLASDLAPSVAPGNAANTEPNLENATAAIDFDFHQVWIPSRLPGFDKAEPGAIITLDRHNHCHSDRAPDTDSRAGAPTTTRTGRPPAVPTVPALTPLAAPIATPIPASRPSSARIVLACGLTSPTCSVSSTVTPWW